MSVMDKKSTELNNNKLTNLFFGGHFVRTIAAIIDLGIVAMLTIGLFFLLSYFVFVPIAKATNVVDYDLFEDVSHEFMDLQISSGLFYYDEENERSDIYLDFKNYEQYDSLIQNYYFDYLPTKIEDDESNQYTNYWYNVFIYGLDDEQNLFSSTISNRYDLVKTYGKEYFAYQVDGGGLPLYDLLATPKASLYENNDPSGNLSEESSTKLLDYFFNNNLNYNFSGEPSIYVLVIEKDFALRDFFVEVYDDYLEIMLQIHVWETLIPQLVALFIISFLAYFIMPIILKNGQTVGKIIMKIGLVNKLGYEVNVWQLLLRYVFPFLFVFALFLIGGTILYLGLGLFVLISYTMVIFSKERKAPHDYVAGTIVIDIKRSVWFKNATEEEKFSKELASTKPIDFSDIQQKYKKD